MSERRSEELYGKFLAVHDTRAVVWDAETTITSADPHPGVVTSSVANSKARVVVHGEQEGTDTYEFRASRGGNLAGRPELLARIKDAGTGWFGWNPPTSPTWLQPVVTTASIRDWLPDLIPLANGDLLCILCEDTDQPGISVTVRSKATSTWSIRSQIWSSSEQSYAGGPMSAAAAVRLQDEGQTLIVYKLTHQNRGGRLRTQVDMGFISEAGDVDYGPDYDTTQHSVLPAALPHDATDSFALSAAAGPSGTVVLVVQQNETAYQFSSIDGGYTFEARGSFAMTGECLGDLCFAGGYWVFGYEGEDHTVRVRRVAAPSAQLSDADEVVVATLHASPGTGIVCRLVADDVGGVWLYAWDHDGGQLQCFHSAAGGAASTWHLVVDDTLDAGARCGVNGAFAQTGLTVGSGVFWDATWHEGQVVMVIRTQQATGRTECMAELRYGGWSDLPMVQRFDAADRADAVSWSVMWWGINNPSFAFTLAGTTPTVSFGTDLLCQIVTGGSGCTYTTQGASLVVNGDCGGALGAACEVVAGLASWRVKITDATDCALLVTQSPTTLTMYDDIASTLLGSAAVSGMIELRVEVSGQRAIVLYREWVQGWQEWTELAQWSGLATGTQTLPFCQLELDPSTTVKLAYMGHLVYDVAAEEHGLVGRSIAYGLNRPADLVGLRVSAIPQYVDAGLYVAMHDGPVLVGEEFEVAPAAGYSTDRAAWTAAMPNTSTKHRAADATDGAILAYSLGDDPVSTTSPAWVVMLDGNAYSAALVWHDGSSWGTPISLSRSYTFAGARSGSSVYPTSVSVSSSEYCDEDELVGGYISFGSGKVRKIVGNTAGKMKASSSSTWRTVQIEVEGVDGTEATSGSFVLVYPRTMHVLTGANVPSTAAGFGIIFYSSTGGAVAPPESYFEHKLLVGPMKVLESEHGLDTTWTHRPRVVDTEMDSGHRRRHKLGEADVQVELHWEDAPYNTYQTLQAGQHDYVAAVSGGAPAAAWRETPQTLRAWVERHGATGAPVLYGHYFRSYPADVQPFGPGRCRGAMLGTIEGEWRLAHAGHGDEAANPTIRGGTIRLRGI